MDLKITQQEVWLSTLVFGAIDFLLVIPLVFIFSDDRFVLAARSITLSSAVFWGIMSMVVMGRYWQFYYRYIYPDWMRSISPLNTLLYAAIGLGLWRLTTVFGNHLILLFGVLGGLEGVAEHIFAIYGLKVLRKVPWLEGLRPFPLILFSFFEYITYWSVAAWLALGLTYFLAQ